MLISVGALRFSIRKSTGILARHICFLTSYVVRTNQTTDLVKNILMGLRDSSSYNNYFFKDRSYRRFLQQFLLRFFVLDDVNEWIYYINLCFRSKSCKSSLQKSLVEMCLKAVAPAGL